MDKLTRLKELKQLLDDGLLTQEEFDKFKSELFSVSAENQNNDSQIPVTSNEENITVEEKTIDSEVFQVNTENIESEKKYVKELNSTQTNHSYWRYILAIVFFLGGGFYIFYHFVLRDKWANEDKIESQQTFDNLNAKTRFTYLTQPIDDLESMSVTGISNEQELYTYLDEVAVFWCSEWKKAKEYQNENKRHEEMLKIDRCINAYPLGFQQGLIMLNDLPMELNTKAREHFQQKVKNLGFDPFWNEESGGESADLDDEIEKFESGSSSDLNEAEYNRQREQAEYESSQAYYNSLETDNNILKGSQIKNESKSTKTQISPSRSTETVITEPEPPNGYAGLMSYIQKNLKYPQSAIENGIEGKVYVEFYVETDGKISDAKVTKGVTEALNTEALRIVKAMPKWIPGKIDGIKSRLKYTLPINFSM
jgi:TonB family protein